MRNIILRDMPRQDGFVEVDDDELPFYGVG